MTTYRQLVLVCYLFAVVVLCVYVSWVAHLRDHSELRLGYGLVWAPDVGLSGDNSAWSDSRGRIVDYPRRSDCPECPLLRAPG